MGHWLYMGGWGQKRSLKKKDYEIDFVPICYSNKSKILDRRLRYLKDHFQYQLYDNVSRSIFAKHRGVFTFILCANLLLWVTVYKRHSHIVFT